MIDLMLKHGGHILLGPTCSNLGGGGSKHCHPHLGHILKVSNPASIEFKNATSYCQPVLLITCTHAMFEVSM